MRCVAQREESVVHENEKKVGTGHEYGENEQWHENDLVQCHEPKQVGVILRDAIEIGFNCRVASEDLREKRARVQNGVGGDWDENDRHWRAAEKQERVHEVVGAVLADQIEEEFT